MASKQLFHNASLRLTGVYLLIIVFISLLFSVGLYRVSSNELERGINGPISAQEKRFFGTGRVSDLEDIKKDRQKELTEAQSRLRSNLIAINVIILLCGGAISYVLARRTLKPIEQAHEAQSRFTADASHELRTPITAMKVETELALTDPKLTLKAAKKQLESNIEEMDKLTSLSEGLLQLAHLEENGLAKQSVSINETIQLAINRVLKKAEQKKQLVEFDDGDDINIRINQAYVVEALVTILDNAVKYSPSKTPIKIAKHLQSKSVDLSITDQGPGIRASEIEHIFDRFYRADSSRTNSAEHGYGIGLSIAKTAAEAHGGTVSVMSTLNKGSTFTLSLPKH